MKQLFFVLIFFTAQSVFAESFYLQKTFSCKDENSINRHGLLADLWKTSSSRDRSASITPELTQLLLDGCSPDAQEEIKIAINQIKDRGWRYRKELLIDELDVISSYRPPNEEIKMINIIRVF